MYQRILVHQEGIVNLEKLQIGKGTVMKAQAVPFHVTFIKAPVRVQAEKFPWKYPHHPFFILSLAFLLERQENILCSVEVTQTGKPYNLL